MNKKIVISAILISFLTYGVYGLSTSKIICFGDSLSDTGNNGRYCDGPLWHEVLAERLNLPIPQHSKSGGLNFAYSGAMSGNDEATDIINVGNQINSYLNLTDGHADPEALYLVWVGGNDFLAKRNPLDLIHNIINHIETLADAGATQFLIPNLPSLIHAPKGRAMAKEAVDITLDYLPENLEPMISYLINKVIHISVGFYNSLLEKQLKNLKSLKNIAIYHLDVYSIFNIILDDLNSYDFSDKSELFYDDLHPSARGHQLIGDFAFKILESESKITFLKTSS